MSRNSSVGEERVVVPTWGERNPFNFVQKSSLSCTLKWKDMRLVHLEFMAQQILLLKGLIACKAWSSSMRCRQSISSVWAPGSRPFLHSSLIWGPNCVQKREGDLNNNAR